MAEDWCDLRLTERPPEVSGAVPLTSVWQTGLYWGTVPDLAPPQVVDVTGTSVASGWEGARWREVDPASATLTVPASRMKSRKEHRVPLSSAALVVLERADGLRGRGRGLVFPGIQGKMVGAAVFGRLLNDLKIDCSPHGFRSSFRSWCSDEGIDREWRPGRARSGRRARPSGGGAGPGPRGRQPGRAVLRPQRRAGAPARGHGGMGSVPGPVAVADF